MVTISMTPANLERCASPSTAPHPHEVAAGSDGPRAAASTRSRGVRVAQSAEKHALLAQLQWAREATAIDAEDILTQADEAVCLG